jgi:hypothetical protein
MREAHPIEPILEGEYEERLVLMERDSAHRHGCNRYGDYWGQR